MARLALCFGIVFFLLMHVHIHHCKPILIPAVFLDLARSNELPYPIDRQESSYETSELKQENSDDDRPKRNCPTYPGQRFHHISKWMCW